MLSAAYILHDLNNLFIKETYFIDKIGDDRILFFWAYLAFASPPVRVYLIDIFNDMHKSKILENQTQIAIILEPAKKVNEESKASLRRPEITLEQV